MHELEDIYGGALEYIAKRIPEFYPRKTISYSSLKEAETCPTRWRTKYLQKIEIPPTPALWVGTATHSALEIYHGGGDAVADVMARSWPFGRPEEHAKCKTQVLRMVNAYVERFTQPEASAIEKRVKVPLTESVELEAVADLVTTDMTLRDYKTSGRHFTPDPLQIAVTALALFKAGIVIERGEICQLRKDLKTKSKIVTLHEYVIDADFMREHVQKIVSILDNTSAYVQLGIWPGPPLELDEAARFCSFACPVPACDKRREILEELNARR